MFSALWLFLRHDSKLVPRPRRAKVLVLAAAFGGPLLAAAGVWLVAAAVGATTAYWTIFAYVFAGTWAAWSWQAGRVP